MEESAGGASPGAQGSGSEISSNGSGGRSEGQEQLEGREEKPKFKKPTLPKLKEVKINGRTERVDEDAVWRDYQKYRAGDERLAAATKKEQEIDAFYKRLEEDPESVLRDPRISAKRREIALKWIEEDLAEEVEEAENPLSKENKDLKAKLKEREDRDTEDKQKAEEAEKRKVIDERKLKLHGTIIEALQSTPLSQHPETKAAAAYEMAALMRAAKAAGEDVTVEELVNHVNSRSLKGMHALANELDGDALMDFFGPEVVKKIHMAALAKIKKSRERPVESFRNEAAFQPKQGQKFIDPSDVRIQLRSRG